MAARARRLFPLLLLLASCLTPSAGVLPGIPGFGDLGGFVAEEHAQRGEVPDDAQPPPGQEVPATQQQPMAPSPQQQAGQPLDPSKLTPEKMVEIEKALSDEGDQEQIMPLIDAISAVPGGTLMLKARVPVAHSRTHSHARSRGRMHVCTATAGRSHAAHTQPRLVPAQNAIKDEVNKDPELNGLLSNIVALGGGTNALYKQPFWARLFATEGAEGERLNSLGLGAPKIDPQTLFRQRAALAGLSADGSSAADPDAVSAVEEGGASGSADGLRTAAAPALGKGINADVAVNAFRTLFSGQLS